MTATIVWSAFAISFIIGAYISWRDEVKARLTLEKRLEPLFTVRAGQDVEKSVVLVGMKDGVPEEAWLRARLDLLSEEPIPNICARLLSIREDAITVPLMEELHLQLHDGKEHVTLRKNMAEFVDLICVKGGNLSIPAFGVARSVKEFEFNLKPGARYEFDVAIAGDIGVSLRRIFEIRVTLNAGVIYATLRVL